MNYLDVYLVISLVSTAMMLVLLLWPHMRLGMLNKVGITVMLVGNVGTVLQIWSGADHYDALINSGLVIRCGLLIITVAMMAHAFKNMRKGGKS